MNFFGKIRQFIQKKTKKPEPRPDGAHTFRAKYISFKELLSANSELLNIIAELEETLNGNRLFAMAYVRTQAARAVFHAMRMIQGLNFISGQKDVSLLLVLDDINKKMMSLMERPKDKKTDQYVLPLNAVNKNMMDWVGGKSANLGELCGTLELPVPPGFAITTHAFDAFMAHNALNDTIAARLREMDPNNPTSIAATSAAIRAAIQQAPLPDEISDAMRAAARALMEKHATEWSSALALRSSAVGEDSDLSFAGQYQTALNISEQMITDTYRGIVASLFTERAIMYRLGKGVREDDAAMGVLCLKMVPAKASGVVYSRDPMAPDQPEILISAVWGLGLYAVNGSGAPDHYKVARGSSTAPSFVSIARKPVQLVAAPAYGVQERPVDMDKQSAACLNADQIGQLADYAVLLENHYGAPQDIEWVLDQRDRLFLLQTRPLALAPAGKQTRNATPARFDNHPILTDQGMIACKGVGCGPVFHVASDEDLTRFPDGGVLVARRSSPRFVIIMPRASAIVTEIGGITGHMASLAREFGVPAILGVPEARAKLAPGALVTVDAYNAVVYQGRVEALPAVRASLEKTHQTPAHQILRRIADLIIPLHLTDPKSPDFKPASCRTLHDIMRMVHELSYKAMFQISDHMSYRQGAAVKLNVQLPIDLFLIDLGQGLSAEAATNNKVPLEAVTSVPLKALLKGMLHEAVNCREPRPVALSGFFAVMREQLLAPPARVERFGDRSYGIVSDKYLNFSSRVGYHYSILDCYCGASVNKNYISFSFKGGAADGVRRNRRVRAISKILEALDFSVEVREDRLNARLVKYEQIEMENRLDIIGRLLQFTRQMDMLMNSEASVQAVADNFLNGNYRLEPG